MFTIKFEVQEDDQICQYNQNICIYKALDMANQFVMSMLFLYLIAHDIEQLFHIDYIL